MADLKAVAARTIFHRTCSVEVAATVCSRGAAAIGGSVDATVISCLFGVKATGDAIVQYALVTSQRDLLLVTEWVSSQKVMPSLEKNKHTVHEVKKIVSELDSFIWKWE